MFWQYRGISNIDELQKRRIRLIELECDTVRPIGCNSLKFVSYRRASSRVILHKELFEGELNVVGSDGHAVVKECVGRKVKSVLATIGGNLPTPCKIGHRIEIEVLCDQSAENRAADQVNAPCVVIAGLRPQGSEETATTIDPPYLC